MGDFLGHAVPGAMFLLLSIWWFLGALLQTRNNLNTKTSRRGLLRPSSSSNARLKTQSRVWYPCPGRYLSKIPLEPIVKVALGITGVIGELFVDGSFTLIDKNGDFIAEHINNHSHTAMYCFFSLSGVVDLVLWCGKVSLPPRIDFVIMSACFWIEGFLFYFHLHGHSEISARLHTILYIVIFITAAVFLLEVFLTQHQSLFGLMRAILLGLQGTWFLQIAFVLYGPNAWENEDHNVEFLAIAFAWHLFVLMSAAVVLFVVFHRFCLKKYQEGSEDHLQEALSDEEEENIHCNLYNT